ncbi:monovalent cation/H+ antiporter subunit D [Variovorax sp. VNK109]|uniref:monovalent cation/H+ antiporter subunit D n=1 Tax=Variovorax sp. VNK109 TaxID=3400919 RepID=UPI003C03B112
MMRWVDWAMPHLVIAPILLPMLTAALMLFFGEHRRNLKAGLGVVSTFMGLGLAIALLVWVKAQPEPAAFGIYLPGNWDVPYGIVLTVDRFSALMLLLAAIAGCAAMLFSVARWHKAGVHFNPLLQIQLMGLNGAFLTTDLFNLFVFFEIMLAASYGLLLHGSGPTRVKSGLHYIAINLAASSLFLVGVSMVYGVSGTLNMADLAQRIPFTAPEDVGLLHTGLAILAVAFLTKAALWPLNFWLVPAYSAAAAPAACIFALLTKVGIYVLLRLSTLLFPPEAGASAGFGSDWLLWGGMATLGFGALGMLSSQRPTRLAGYAVIMSSGTLMSAIGFGQVPITAAALYYLPSSTLAICALFLLVELVERSRDPEPGEQLAPEDEEDRLPFALADLELGEDDVPEGVNLAEDETALIGRAIPAAIAFLGLTFLCCTLLVAGLPPLSGFIGKFAILSALLATGAPGMREWMLLSLLIVSGLFALIAMTRVGMRFFWAPQGRTAPRLRVIECAPIVALIALCVLFTIKAEPVMRYARATAQMLHDPARYVDAVMSTKPRPGPVAMKEDSP